MDRVTEEQLNTLIRQAWAVRDNASVVGNTRVGCALVTREGQIFVGCNVEHPLRCHDIHAEVNTLSSMIAAGAKNPQALVIVAERKRFTPCGGCVDWIMHLGSGECVVYVQSGRDSQPTAYRAADLMPYYPL